jgi:hypothetical protein
MKGTKVGVEAPRFFTAVYPLADSEDWLLRMQAEAEDTERRAKTPARMGRMSLRTRIIIDLRSSPF